MHFLADWMGVDQFFYTPRTIIDLYLDVGQVDNGLVMKVVELLPSTSRQTPNIRSKQFLVNIKYTAMKTKCKILGEKILEKF